MSKVRIYEQTTTVRDAQPGKTAAQIAAEYTLKGWNVVKLVSPFTKRPDEFQCTHPQMPGVQHSIKEQP